MPGSFAHEFFRRRWCGRGENLSTPAENKRQNKPFPSTTSSHYHLPSPQDCTEGPVCVSLLPRAFSVRLNSGNSLAAFTCYAKKILIMHFLPPVIIAELRAFVVGIFAKDDPIIFHHATQGAVCILLQGLRTFWRTTVSGSEKTLVVVGAGGRPRYLCVVPMLVHIMIVTALSAAYVAQ